MSETQGPLRRNAARCLRCGETLLSTDAREFVACGCGAVCVDGGSRYIRRLWDGSLGSAHEVFADESVCEHSFHPLSPNCSGCGIEDSDHDPVWATAEIERQLAESTAALADTFPLEPHQWAAILDEQ